MAQSELKRQIGLFSAGMLIAGDMIGTGIFISTGAIAETLPTPGGVLLVWLFGGLLALAGALTCAELSASMPYAGGDYNYIREAYGKLVRSAAAISSARRPGIRASAGTQIRSPEISAHSAPDGRSASMAAAYEGATAR